MQSCWVFLKLFFCLLIEKYAVQDKASLSRQRNSGQPKSMALNVSPFFINTHSTQIKLKLVGLFQPLLY